MGLELESFLFEQEQEEQEEQQEQEEQDQVNIEALLLELEQTEKLEQAEKHLEQKTTAQTQGTKCGGGGRTSIYRGVSMTAGGKFGAKYGGKRIAGASACATAEEAARKYDAHLRAFVARKTHFCNFCAECGGFRNALHLTTHTSQCTCGEKKKKAKAGAAKRKNKAVVGGAVETQQGESKKTKLVHAQAQLHKQLTFQQMRELLLQTTGQCC